MNNTETAAKGEANGKTILTSSQVSEIRTLLNKRGCTIAYIADRFNVSKGAIQAIKHQRSWGWLK